MTDYDALEKRLLIELEGTDIHWAGEDPCPALVPYQPCNCHTGQVAKRAADAIRDLRAERDALRKVLQWSRKYVYQHQRTGDMKGMQIGQVPTVYPEDMARIDAALAAQQQK